MNINDSRILIIGTYGQVGGSFYKLISGRNHVLFTDVQPKSPDIKALDLCDAGAIRNVVEMFRPNVIINCAAYTAVDLAEAESALAQRINAEAVKILAIAAESIGSILVHYSTDYVFDGSGEKPWLETDRPSPVNTYGKSKLEGETAILDHCRRGYIFRTQWVYDKTGKNFVNTMLRLGSERVELAVVGDQIGAPTSSDVIAEYTLIALERILAGEMLPGIYHLTCRGETSWHGFAEAIFVLARAKGQNLKIQNIKKIETKDFPTPAARPKNSRLSLTKFEAAIGKDLPHWKSALGELFSAP